MLLTYLPITNVILNITYMNDQIIIRKSKQSSFFINFKITM